MGIPATEKTAILLADDSPAFCAAASEVLSSHGFLVTSVGTGIDAVAEARKRPYDLITLDVEMPGMDGIEALRILRSICPEVPVIMISGASTMTTALAAIRQGAYDYILKPFEPDDLLLSVQRALQQRALVDENKRLIQDLRSFNEHLEEIVRERTQALQRSEKKLVEYAHELESAHAQLLLSHEELQEAYRKLRDLDSLKAKFISITSHELRTPLTTIYGYASLAATQPLTAEKQAQALGAIERNVERLMAIVAEITDIAQLKEKRLYLRRVPLRLETLLPEVVDELRPLAEGRRQAVATSVEGTLPPILADRNRITQVLQQLLLNAIRFTPDGGSISVTARLLAGRQPQVQVSVADTGIGIDADKLATVFEEFYEAIPWQHHHTGTTEFGSAGLGLGLSVVQGIVEEHGGRIWAESARSTGRSGSTFHVVFPAQTGV